LNFKDGRRGGNSRVERLAQDDLRSVAKRLWSGISGVVSGLFDGNLALLGVGTCPVCWPRECVAIGYLIRTGPVAVEVRFLLLELVNERGVVGVLVFRIGLQQARKFARNRVGGKQNPGLQRFQVEAVFGVSLDLAAERGIAIIKRKEIRLVS
jgi:hypothetical protein